MGDLERKETAYELHQKIIINGNLAAQSLIQFAKDLKKMRDENLFIELGFKNFSDYCESSVGIKRRQAYKYIFVIESFPDDFVHSSAQLGIKKLELLGQLDTEERETFVQQNPVDEMTTRELHAAIKAKKEAEEKAAEAQSKAERESERSADLIDEVKRLNKQLNAQPEVIEKEVIKEVIPEETKSKLQEYEALKTAYEKVRKEKTYLENQNKALLGSAEKDKLEYATKASTFKATINDFLYKMGSLPFLGNELRTSDQAAREYETGIQKIEKWCQDMRNTLFIQKNEMIYEVEDVL